MNPVITLPGTGPADAAARAHWRSSWKDALDAVALDLDDVEYLLDRIHSSVDAAAATQTLATRAALFRQLDGSLGPLPMEFADRARALLARQRQAAYDLGRAMTSNRRHARATAAMRMRSGDSAPVYIDAEA